MEIFPIKNFDLLIELIKNKNNLLLKSNFMSITFGALGAENYNSINLINFFIEKKINITPHISCINLNIKSYKNIINTYYLNNIKNLLILKGDECKDLNNTYYSYNLINLIKENYENFFNLYAAIYTEFHPNSINYKNDLKNNIIKINTNINFAITQYFYNIDSYYYLIDDISKLKKFSIIIIPGIMPINCIEQLIKFSNICKSEIPIWLIKRLNISNINNNNIINYGLDIIINLCFKLIKFKVKNLHFYTMNNMKIIGNICEKILLNINI